MQGKTGDLPSLRGGRILKSLLAAITCACPRLLVEVELRCFPMASIINLVAHKMGLFSAFQIRMTQSATASEAG